MVPTVNISAFTTESATYAQRTDAAKALVEALHSFGFTKVIGHGLSKEEIDEALDWAKRLFDLPYEDKMKAPHPEARMPHRGYSGVGQEKVYSQDEIAKHGGNDGENAGESLRKITDFKESFEIGSEHDPIQTNIWPPKDFLPGFRAFESSLYERFCDLAEKLLDIIGLGLSLEDEEKAELEKYCCRNGNQFLLLHYPAASKEKLRRELFARLPPHRDWGAMTVLFQDSNGGLELKDAATGEYLHAQPEENAFVLNVGDMFQRLTNDYFIFPLHRVTVPDADTVPDSGLPSRYSIPYFFGPHMEHTVATLPRFINSEKPAKYNPVRFDKYGDIVAKYQY